MTAPESIDCHQAAQRLHELMDGELTADWEAAVRRHLDACAQCFGLYEFEQAFKRFVAMSARSVGAPDDLKSRIRTRLGEEDREQTG